MNNFVKWDIRNDMEKNWHVMSMENEAVTEKNNHAKKNNVIIKNC